MADAEKVVWKVFNAGVREAHIPFAYYDGEWYVRTNDFAKFSEYHTGGRTICDSRNLPYLMLRNVASFAESFTMPVSGLRTLPMYTRNSDGTYHFDTKHPRKAVFNSLVCWAEEVASILDKEIEQKNQTAPPKECSEVDESVEAFEEFARKLDDFSKLLAKSVNRSNELERLAHKHQKVSERMSDKFDMLVSTFVGLFSPSPSSSPLQYYSVGRFAKVYGVSDELNTLGKEGKSAKVRSLGIAAKYLSQKRRVSIGSEPVDEHIRKEHDYTSETRNTYREDIIGEVFWWEFGAPRTKWEVPK